VPPIIVPGDAGRQLSAGISHHLKISSKLLQSRPPFGYGELGTQQLHFVRTPSYSCEFSNIGQSCFGNGLVSFCQPQLMD
jgi:hypothetical protein